MPAQVFHITILHWDADALQQAFVHLPPPYRCTHRRRIKTEAKVKVIASVWCTELLQFLATRMIWRKGLSHPILQKRTGTKYWRGKQQRQPLPLLCLYPSSIDVPNQNKSFVKDLFGGKCIPILVRINGSPQLCHIGSGHMNGTCTSRWHC